MANGLCESEPIPRESAAGKSPKLAAEHILLDSPLTYARIYFDGLVRATFDPVSTEFLRFFNLYPKQGELLAVDVDKGVITTIEALLGSPLLFWSIAVLLPLQLTYLSCAVQHSVAGGCWTLRFSP